MRDPNVLDDESEGRGRKAGYEVSLFPWIPLSAEETIPVPADWVVTMVEPPPNLCPRPESNTIPQRPRMCVFNSVAINDCASKIMDVIINNYHC